MVQGAAGSQLPRPPRHGAGDRGPAYFRRLAAGWVADESCFVYAIVKHEPPAGLEALYFILPPPT
jgi:hypothetical protein